MRRFPVVLCSLALLAASGTGCAYVSAVNQVETYRSTRPQRPFRELGLVEGRRHQNEQGEVTIQTLEFRMKEQAYHLGAHAVVDVRDNADAYGNVYLVGTAVQYTDVPPPSAPGYQSQPNTTVATPPDPNTTVATPPPQQPPPPQ